MAGICLIRLEQMRPAGLPSFCGLSSENAAHRIAVEWQEPAGAWREGVYIPRRDTGSRLNFHAQLGVKPFTPLPQAANFTLAAVEDRGEARAVVSLTLVALRAFSFQDVTAAQSVAREQTANFFRCCKLHSENEIQ